MYRENNASDEKVATLPKKKAIDLDLQSKYPELTNESWRQALVFTLVAEKELRLTNAQTTSVLIALIGHQGETVNQPPSPGGN